MIRWKITRVEGRQRDTGAAMVDGLHHGLEPGGVEHGHHLHLRLAFHAQLERLHLEDVGHVVGMAQLNCLWTASCSCQSYEMIGKWRWPQDTPIEVAMIMIAATMVMMTMNMNGWELNSGDLRRKVREEQMMETQGKSKSI